MKLISVTILFFILPSLLPSVVSADQREPQVQIEAKIAEVNHSQARELGVNWGHHDSDTAQMRSLGHVGQAGNIGAAKSAFDFNPFDFSNPQSAPKVLSEPHVQTLNNEKTNIAAAPQIPAVPQIQSDKPINLNVVPEVQNDGNIHMKVLPQVSTLVQVPDGNTAVVGGLMQENPEKTVDKVPFLGAIPLIGNLFRQKLNDQKKENLMVFVTPTIIQPTDN